MEESNPQEDKPQEKETQNVVDSPEGRHSLTCLWRFLAEYWCWLKKHKYDVISGFIVAVVAVYIAFCFTGWGDQRAFNKTTRQRLELVYLENLYNGTAAKEILDTYVDANSLGINVLRLNSTAALAAFQDSNVLQFLPFYKVSLLRSYMDSISTLNQSLLLHQGVLETQNYRRTPQEKDARQIVYKNAAAVFAMAFVLQKELVDFGVNLTHEEKIQEQNKYIEIKKELLNREKIGKNFTETEKNLSDREIKQHIETLIKLIKEKALKGEVLLSKE